MSYIYIYDIFVDNRQILYIYIYIYIILYYIARIATFQKSAQSVELNN